MNNSFTAEAKVLWQKVPEWAKEKVLANVWCGTCRGITTMLDFSVEVIEGDLLLTGNCKVCNSKVVRVLESAKHLTNMRVQFTVQGLPPKKDGANSMWRKSTEVPRLKALRSMALQAMQGVVWQSTPLYLRLRICAALSEGDLDNFITGICDGLMGAHARTPLILDEWQDVPEAIRPRHAIAFHNDKWIMQIVAQRILPIESERYYEVELESLAE